MNIIRDIWMGKETAIKGESGAQGAFRIRSIADWRKKALADLVCTN